MLTVSASWVPKNVITFFLMNQMQSTKRFCLINWNLVLGVVRLFHLPPWSKSFRTRHRAALSFGRFQFFFFCCVGRSVIDVLSDFQLDSLTFVEVTLFRVHLSLCVVSIFHKKKKSSTLQQQVCIKFCVKNGFNGAQTLEMLEKCFGNHTVTRSNVFRWHEHFRSGRESV